MPTFREGREGHPRGFKALFVLFMKSYLKLPDEGTKDLDSIKGLVKFVHPGERTAGTQWRNRSSGGP